MYVIYTGERQTRLAELSLSKEFFAGKDCAVDVKVKMIYDGTVKKQGKVILSINISLLPRYVMSR